MKNTADKKTLLSISLLSSGRAKTIKKCLDSLCPIMEALPCELIIVDTGCSEEIVKLLKEYTEKIIPFTWCNDFSKARNVGLKEAAGEWFLYLDDDEWFEDSSEIISFFKTGEYKDYAAACYIQRNYADYEERKWDDTWVSRLIRLDEDTRFESSIHEYLYPVKGMSKLIHSYVKHFGYVYDSEEEKMAHAWRNISLLLEVMEKEPENIRWWIQLAQEYFTIRDLDKLETLCKKALKQFDAVDAYNVNNFRGTFYAGLLMKHLMQNEYEKAEECFKTAIADSRNTDMCKAMMYARIAEMYYTLGDFNECMVCCEEYIKRYEFLYGNDVECFMQGSFFTYDACNINVRNNVYSFYIKCCVLKGDVNGFITYFYKIGWDAEMMNIYHTFVGDVLEGFSTLPYMVEFVKMAQTMMDRRGINQLTMEKLKELEKENPQQFEVLYNIFSKTNPPALYREAEPKQSSITPEMQQLAIQIKGRIQVLLSQNMYKEADTILGQLKTFVPMDEEMTVMEQQIKEKLSSF